MQKQSAIREKNMKRFEARLQKTCGIGLLKPDPRITRLAPYGYVIKYFAEKVKGIPRAAFVAAMQLEGVHCDGLFYEPVYKSSLFPVDSTDFPALSWGGRSRWICDRCIRVRSRRRRLIRRRFGFRTSISWGRRRMWMILRMRFTRCWRMWRS